MCTQCFYQNYYPWTYKSLTNHDGILHSITSDQGTYLIANEIWQWAYANGSHWCYHIPNHPEAAILVVQQNSLKSQQ